jgi:hypothetical protein
MTIGAAAQVLKAGMHGAVVRSGQTLLSAPRSLECRPSLNSQKIIIHILFFAS